MGNDYSFTPHSILIDSSFTPHPPFSHYPYKYPNSTTPQTVHAPGSLPKNAIARKNEPSYRRLNEIPSKNLTECALSRTNAYSTKSVTVDPKAKEDTAKSQNSTNHSHDHARHTHYTKNTHGEEPQNASPPNKLQTHTKPQTYSSHRVKLKEPRLSHHNTAPIPIFVITLTLPFLPILNLSIIRATSHQFEDEVLKLIPKLKVITQPIQLVPRTIAQLLTAVTRAHLTTNDCQINSTTPMSHT
jgi:hypothetical protein